jgi:hypothetical protein
VLSSRWLSPVSPRLSPVSPGKPRVLFLAICNLCFEHVTSQMLCHQSLSPVVTSLKFFGLFIVTSVTIAFRKTPVTA